MFFLTKVKKLSENSNWMNWHTEINKKLAWKYYNYWHFHNNWLSNRTWIDLKCDNSLFFSLNASKTIYEGIIEFFPNFDAFR